jgi:chloramphenicol-sensitive protein RarD
MRRSSGRRHLSRHTMATPRSAPPIAPAASAEARSAARGVAFGIAAYSFWGVMPVFWKQLGHVGPFEILAHRFIWGVGAFAAITALTGQWSALVAAMRDRRTVLTMAASGALLATNWLTFVYAISEGRLLEASLGYFINPLISVLLGMIFLGERLRPAQWLAVGLATAGVVQLAVRADGVPWLSFLLAGSFALYGLLRKTARVAALPGSTLETAFIAPFAAVYLAVLAARGDGALGHADLPTHGLLIASGIVTALPLVWFTVAARSLSLATVGFLQYLAPTGQFLLAVLAYGEIFTDAHQRSFACIWAGLAVFSADALVRARRGR